MADNNHTVVNTKYKNNEPTTTGQGTQNMGGSESMSCKWMSQPSIVPLSFTNGEKPMIMKVWPW